MTTPTHPAASAEVAAVIAEARRVLDRSTWCSDHPTCPCALAAGHGGNHMSDRTVLRSLVSTMVAALGYTASAQGSLRELAELVDDMLCHALPDDCDEGDVEVDVSLRVEDINRVHKLVQVALHQPSPSERAWYGVWATRKGYAGHWHMRRDAPGEDLQTTRTEAERTAAALNGHAAERTDSLGWRYEIRPYPSPPAPEPASRCRPGAWGGPGCAAHDGHDIGPDGMCIEGRATDCDFAHPHPEDPCGRQVAEPEHAGDLEALAMEYLRDHFNSRHDDFDVAGLVKVLRRVSVRAAAPDQPRDVHCNVDGCEEPTGMHLCKTHCPPNCGAEHEDDGSAYECSRWSGHDGPHVDGENGHSWSSADLKVAAVDYALTVEHLRAEAYGSALSAVASAPSLRQAKSLAIEALARKPSPPVIDQPREDGVARVVAWLRTHPDSQSRCDIIADMIELGDWRPPAPAGDGDGEK